VSALTVSVGPESVLQNAFLKKHLFIIFNDQSESRGVAAHQLHIREIPGSNLGPETGYPDVFVIIFSLSMQTLR
jgi:hypothetical protein